MSMSSASVYVLYTGGTIGSAGSPLEPMSGPQFEQLVASMPGLGGGQVAGYTDPSISYTMDYLSPVLDSSNMTPLDWLTIAGRILANYADHDGFVVLHGTDTMAFSASAMSFLLAGLSKPVIFTGSQIPLSLTLNDALPNLVGAIVLAGTLQIPESCLYFDSLLLRGNRSAKVNANQFAAFESPNFPPLATLGTELTVNTALVMPPPPADQSLSDPSFLAQVQVQMDQFQTAFTQFSIISLILFPGIQSSNLVQTVLQGTQPPIKGIVLQAFGEGNGPSDQTFLQTLTAFHNNGGVLIDNTQVLMGSVNIDAYETGSGLSQAGAISPYDMTPEASLAKLIYLTAQGLDQTEIQTQMQTDLHGEITEPDNTGTESLRVF